jgi:hypothetical protein
MAVTYDDQSTSRNFRQRLYPRPVRHEPTAEQVRQEQRASIREAIHADLHVLYDRYAADEYKGPLNSHQGVNGIIPAAKPSMSSPGSGCSRALGVELHPDFVSYLDKDHLKASLWQGLLALREERPNLHQIIWAHLVDDLTDKELGEKFHLDRETAAKRMDYGFDVIAGKMGAWRK